MSKPKKRILIVDDDEDILEALRLTMQFEGYEVKTTAKGEKTLAIVIDFKPDLILLDILLSGIDGRMVCKTLKSDSLTKHIPVLMLSAHPAGSKSIGDYGADAFIEKPFELTRLIEQVDFYL